MMLPLKNPEDIQHKHLFDAMNKSPFSQIKRTIESNIFPWRYNDGTAYPGEAFIERTFQFFHPVYVHKIGKRSSLLDDFNLDKLIYSVLTDAGEKVNTILRLKLNLNVNVGEKVEFTPHVDTDCNHKVGILYFNDCDGETTLYREYDHANLGPKFFSNNKERYQYNIFKKFYPVENSLLIFDGCMYHSGSSPTNTNRRIIMNINYTVF